MNDIIKKMQRPSLLPCERLTDKEIFELTEEQLSKLSAYDIVTILQRKAAVEALKTDEERLADYQILPEYAEGIALLKEMEGMTTEEKVKHLHGASNSALSQAGVISEELCIEIANHIGVDPYQRG